MDEGFGPEFCRVNSKDIFLPSVIGVITGTLIAEKITAKHISWASFTVFLVFQSLFYYNYRNE